MKLTIAISLSFILGLASMYIFMSRSFSAVNQFYSGMRLDTQITYLEMLKENDIEQLMKFLKVSIACESTVYEDNLNSFFGNKTNYSEKVLKRARPYVEASGECGKIRKTMF